MPASDLRHRVATHEAGHVVAGLLLGVGIEYVAIHPDGSGFTQPNGDPLCALHFAVISATGAAAEELVIPGGADIGGSEQDDFDIIRVFSGRMTVAAARRRAKKLLRPYLSQLLLLASVLYVRDRMTGEEVLRLLGLQPIDVQRIRRLRERKLARRNARGPRGFPTARCVSARVTSQPVVAQQR